VYTAQLVVRELAEAARHTEKIRSFEEFEQVVTRRVTQAERSLEISEAELGIVFSETPSVAAVVDALSQIDREARRVAAGFRDDVSPNQLRGRGVRLVPRAEGLVVRDASAGSLDIVILLGALYSLVTSQPVSFALNIAALLGYSKMVIQAVLPSQDAGETELEVPPLDVLDSVEVTDVPDESALVSTPFGPVIIPKDFEYLRIDYKGRDGTELKIRAKPEG
jgi:hypothetical protein